MTLTLRKSALLLLAKQAGIVTDLVQRSLENTNSPQAQSNFKNEFLKTPPGPTRESLILAELTKSKPNINLIPITVDGPSNTKITYKVMPDYVTIDGIRVPMSGTTAQKVADLYGMKLPTSKMSKQIWDAADTKIRPTPLSAGGNIGGQYYSGQEVVKHKISDSDSSLAYNQMIQDELKNHPNANLIAGHMKDVIAPEGDPNKLGLYGWFGKDGKPLQNSAQTPHDTTVHTEYGAGVRLVDNSVTVTTSDGKVINTTMDKVLNDPNFSKSIANGPGVKKYKL